VTDSCRRALGRLRFNNYIAVLNHQKINYQETNHQETNHQETNYQETKDNSTFSHVKPT
jgi:hypothetical protein